MTIDDTASATSPGPTAEAQGEPSLDERWDAVLLGTASEDQRAELVSEAVAALNRLMEDRDDSYQAILDAVGAVVDHPHVHDQAWFEVDRALTLVAGAPLPRLLGWLVLDEAYVTRLDQIRSQLTPAAERFLTDVLMRYGPGLERAFYMSWAGTADDWRSVLRDVRHDLTTDRSTVRLRIIKFNGEVVTIEGGPDSLLSLTRTLLSAVNLFERSAFSQDPESFVAEVTTALETFGAAPVVEQVTGEGSPGGDRRDDAEQLPERT